MWAAREVGRDPSALTVVARVNVPLVREPIGEGRPFLGGSPRQIAEDITRLDGTGVDHLIIANIAAPGDVEEAAGLLEELKAATGEAA